LSRSSFLASQTVRKWKALPSSPLNRNELVRPVHNRMPVILQREDEEQWLDVSRTPFVKAKSLLQPYAAELMDAHDVSPIVNSAKYDGPECIRPVSDDDIPSTGQLSLL
jgi:SOS response associated peptidase (SRAP)